MGVTAGEYLNSIYSTRNNIEIRFQLSAVTNQGKVYVCGMDSYTYAPGRDNQIWNTTLHPASFNVKNLYIVRNTGSFVTGLLLGTTGVSQKLAY